MRALRLYWLLPTALLLLFSACGKVVHTSHIDDLKHQLDAYTGSQLKVLCWGRFIEDKTFTRFAENTGVQLEIVRYHSVEEFWELYRKGGYDVVMTTQYVIMDLIDQGELMPIDYDRVQNSHSMMHSLKQSVKMRPLLRHSLPYLYGAIVLAYNRQYFDYIPRSWKELFEPPQSEYYQGQLALFDSEREVLGVVLKVQGHSVNTEVAEEIEAAGQYVRESMKLHYPLVTAEKMDEMLASEEIYIGMAWSGDVARIQEGNHNLRMAIPDEGSIAVLECLAICKASKNAEAAEFLLEYLYLPEVAAEVTNHSYYANTNVESRQHVKTYILNGPSYFNFLPSGSGMEMIRNLPKTEHLYDSQWNELKSYYEQEILPEIEQQIIF